MSKSAKKRPMASAPAAVPITKSSRHSAGDPEPKRADRGSKQSRVIALLQSPAGATIEAMMKATARLISLLRVIAKMERRLTNDEVLQLLRNEGGAS